MKLPKNEHSIRNKLLMTMIGLIILLVTLSTITQILAQKEILETESNLRIDLMKDKLADRGETLVISLTDQVRNKMATVNLSLLPEILRKAIADDKDLKYAILMDFRRTAYIHTALPELEQETLNSQQDLHAAQQTERSVHEYERDGQSYIEYIEPIQISMEPWGLLRLGFSLKHLNEEILFTKKAIMTQTHNMILRSLITACIFILLGIVIVTLVSNKLSRPLMKLTRLANTLANGDFSAARKIEPSSTYEINALASALVDMSGKLKSSYGELEDYSRTLEQKVKTRTNQLEEARDEAVSANKSKSEFLSIVSHEIRTPMNAILGISRLLMKTDLSYKQHDYLNKIQASANILLSIIKDILDFSKIEAGKLELEQVEFNLGQVLDHLSSLISFNASEKGLSFNVTIAEDVPLQLNGDSMRLVQVLLNLANNAVKFTDSGEINVNIVRISPKDPKAPDDPITLHFSIEDTGIGLSSEQITRLFQPFTQADVSTTRRYGGTGMGLAICKRLVELMGGTISVRSKLNEGSVFSFTAQFSRRTSSLPTPVKFAESLNQLHAVVLEQDLNNRELICTYLTSWQITTTVVTNEDQAIEKFSNWKVDTTPQLLLLGENSAQQSGFSTAHIITNAVKNTRIKIIMMCQDLKQTVSEQDHQGVDRILNKPVNASLLLDAIMDLCVDTSHQFAPLPELRLPDFKGIRLLLVEDQLINQLVAREFLQHAGFTVSIADNGKKALELLQENVYDAVIMDLQMPVLDGFETTRLIRSSHKFADLPIIAMTAHVMTGEKERCLQAGMNDYIAKPFDEDKLYVTLGKWLKPAER